MVGGEVKGMGEGDGMPLAQVLFLRISDLGASLPTKEST